MLEKKVVTFTLNGQVREVLVPANMNLLDLLRNVLCMTGTKKGCEEGECGACTVIMDGRPVNACLVMAHALEGHDVTTVEGLAKDGDLNIVQKKFIEKWAFQCGYCTPGMIMSAKCLLDRNPHPTELEIREAIEGNLCRCTGYVKIVDAVMAAAEEMEREGSYEQRL